MSHKLAKYLRMSPIQGSIVNRVQSKETDVGATRKVRAILPGFLHDAAFRSLFYRERWTVPEIKAKFRGNKGGSGTTILSRCGSVAALCPFCATLGTQKRDSYRHGRFYCMNPTMVAARNYCDAMLSTRITAEGRCWQAYPADKFAIGSAKSDGRNTPARPIRQGASISWAKAKDEASLKSPGVADITVSGTRIRCLHATLLEKCAPDQNGAQAMARALRWCLETASDKTGFVGQVHPSHRAWFAEYLDISSELLQTPCTVSAGIFNEKPTLVTDSIPPEDRALWGNLLDDVCSIEWQSKPWEKNGMACIRSGDKAVLETVMAKARLSAKTGRRILLLLEHGDAEKEAQILVGERSIPAEMKGCIRVQHLVSYPSNQLMWAGSRGWDGDWRIDSTGVFQSDELEGQAAKQRSREGKPVGFNENRGWMPGCTPPPLAH
jgi:hypothetical protein